MTTFLEINGAKVEKTFFDENVKEARGYEWSSQSIPSDRTHVHCMICDVTMDKGTHVYKSNGGWLCAYCFDNFIKTDLMT